MKERQEDLDPAMTAWRMFEKTGSLSYYLLYNHIKDK